MQRARKTSQRKKFSMRADNFSGREIKTFEWELLVQESANVCGACLPREKADKSARSSSSLSIQTPVEAQENLKSCTLSVSKIANTKCKIFKSRQIFHFGRPSLFRKKGFFRVGRIVGIWRLYFSLLLTNDLRGIMQMFPTISDASEGEKDLCNLCKFAEKVREKIRRWLDDQTRIGVWQGWKKVRLWPSHCLNFVSVRSSERQSPFFEPFNIEPFETRPRSFQSA